MSDQRAIVEALGLAAERGEGAVVASVVRTAGATYRGVGARMIVRDDDSTVGLLSGGCLESDLIEHAKRARETGAASIISYDGRSDDELIWGLGLGCNGLVEVLIEPRAPLSVAPLAALLASAYNDVAPGVIATVVSAKGVDVPKAGARLLVRATGEVLRDGEWGSGGLLGQVVADSASPQLDARRGMNLDYMVPAAGGDEGECGTVQLSFEIYAPTIDVVICGSGPDAVPVARLASALGWNVTVVDPRPVKFVPAGRFAGAHVVECGHSEQLGGAVDFTSRTAAIIMSHNYERDLDYLDVLTAAEVAYIGLLGPRARTERMLGDLAARGRPVSDAMHERVYGPIGLDVGGDGPEEIALSIIAELSAVMHGRSAVHLRRRTASIHDSSVVG